MCPMKGTSKSFKEHIMNVIFLGPPGSGKGTVAAKITDGLHLPHISTGDLFRNAIKLKTNLGLKIKAIIDAGGLVPDEITIQVIKQRFKEEDITQGYFLDGFPRTIEQAKAFEKISKVDVVVDLNLDDDEIIKRLSGRRVCKNCGSSFHIDYIMPKRSGFCDHCDGELYIRDDDHIESIKKRLEVYYSLTTPLKAFYENNKVLKSIDASKSPAQVLENAIALLYL